MKKIILFLMMGLLLFTITACKEKSEKKQSEKYENNIYADENGRVELCDYKNLKGEKIIYEVREEEIQDEIYYYVSDYVKEKKIKRPLRDGDCIVVAFKATMDGEILENWAKEDGYEIEVGDGAYGDEVDKKLIGAKIGDTLKFKVQYTEADNPFETGEGTVSYVIKIASGYEYIMPEFTDEFLQENIGIESEEALRAYVSAELMDTYEYNSHFQLREAMIQEVVDQSTVLEYSDTMYNEAKSVVEAQWLSDLEMFDITTIEEMMEAFGMTEEDLEVEIKDYINKKMVLHAICKVEKLELTDEEYQERLVDYVIDWGYETEEELLEEYGEEFIYDSIQEDKVADFLIEKSTITERIALDSEYE